MNDMRMVKKYFIIKKELKIQKQSNAATKRKLQKCSVPMVVARKCFNLNDLKKKLILQNSRLSEAITSLTYIYDSSIKGLVQIEIFCC